MPWSSEGEIKGQDQESKLQYKEVHKADQEKLYLKKFDAKAQRGIFLGYSERSKAYRVYNSETLCVEESMHVKLDEKEPGNETPEQVESFADIQDFEDTRELDQIDASEVSPEVVPTPEAQEEVATVNKKTLITLKLLLQLQDWKQSGYFYPMCHTPIFDLFLFFFSF